MSVTVGDFIGSWKINWATGPGNVLTDGHILIGTGSAWGDTAPFLTESYQTVVGFALVSDGQVVMASGSHEGEQPLLLMFDGGQLRWTGFYKQQPLRIFISAAEVTMAGGGSHVTVYGNTVYGDPEQVGVWGGSGSPPPDPPEPPEP